MNETSRHSIISAVISIGFVVVVQIFAAPHPVFRFLLPAFLVYLGLVSAYNYFYLKRRGVYNFWALLRPALFITAWFGAFFIIPDPFWRGVFLLVGVPIIYLVERTQSNQGEQLLVNETLLTAFTGLMTVTALSHYYLISGTWYLLAVFVLVLLLARGAYDWAPQTNRTKWISAVVLGLVLTEIFWVSSFLPLHYSALAILGFSTFYCTWTLGYYFLYNHLTPKKVQFHVVMALLFTAVIMAVTPWRILQ